MPWWLGIPLIIASTVLFIKDDKKGLVLYLILASLAPVTYFGGSHIAYRTIGFVPIGVIFLINLLVRYKRLDLGPLQITYIAYTAVTTVSTLIAVVLYDATPVIGMLIGLARINLIIIMAGMLFEKNLRYYDQCIFWIISGNFIACFVQLVFPDSLAFFCRAYPHSVSTTIYEIYGRAIRGMGLVGTPSSIGPLALLGGIYASFQLLKNIRVKRYWILLAMCAFCGGYSASKPYVFGIVPFLLLMFGIEFFIKSLKSTRRLLITRGIIIIAGSVLVREITMGYVRLVYSSNYIGSLRTMLVGRYYNILKVLGIDIGQAQAEMGNELAAQAYAKSLSNTYEVISEHPFIGVGASTVAGEFLGDSTYLSLLHSAGIIGLLIFFALFLVLFIRAWKTKSLLPVMLLIGLAGGGLSVLMETMNYGIIFLCFLYALIPARETIKIQIGKVIASKEKQARRTVLFISPYSPPEGGIMRLTHMFVDRGLPDGFKIRVVDTSMGSNTHWSGDAINIFNEIPRTFRIIVSLIYNLFLFRPDAAHINYSNTPLGIIREALCLALLRMFGIPVSAQIHGDASVVNYERTRLTKPALQYFLSHIDKIMVFPGKSKEFLMERFHNLEESKFILMPNTIEDELIRENVTDVVGGHGCRVAFIGRLSKAKGIYDLINVASETPDIHFSLIGENVNNLSDVPNNVTCEGNLSRSQVFKKLYQSDVFFFPSHFEGFPMSVLEAMACGLPVVSAKCGAVPYMIDSEGGILVEIGNVQDMISAITKLANDADLRKNMGEYNIRKCRKEYAYSKISQRFSEIYNEIIRQSNKKWDLYNECKQ